MPASFSRSEHKKQNKNSFDHHCHLTPDTDRISQPVPLVHATKPTMKDSKGSLVSKSDNKKRLSIPLPQTKAKRTLKLIKQSGSVTLFFDSQTLRDYFVKNTLRSKKDFINYLAQDKTLSEMIDLVLLSSGELTAQSADHCHYSAHILSTTASPHLLVCKLLFLSF